MSFGPLNPSRREFPENSLSLNNSLHSLVTVSIIKELTMAFSIKYLNTLKKKAQNPKTQTSKRVLK